MKITFAGVGNAFTTQDYYQSSFFVEENGKNLLVDCGGDARFSLGELGITNANLGKWIDSVYLSHLHNDHIGGMEFLAFITYFTKSPKPNLFIKDELVDGLWQITKIGLDSLQNEEVSLKTYFNVNPIGKSFVWQNNHFRLVQGMHVWANKKLMPVYGLAFKDIYFSADTILCGNVLVEYDKANLIFQDCETLPWKSGVHAHYDDLKLLSPATKSKMWLYHYAPNPTQDAVADGFAGFIKKGQVFNV